MRQRLAHRTLFLLIGIFCLVQTSWAVSSSTSSENSDVSPVAMQTEDDKKEAAKRLGVFGPEAPDALLGTKINDKSVELFVLGSWKTNIGLGLQGNVYGESSSTLPVGIMVPWNNAVDLDISLWIERHWFFETSLHDTLDTSTFLVGYQNNDSIGLRYLIVGNKRIGSTLTYSGSPGYPAEDGIPGIAASWQTENSKHEAFIRMQTSDVAVQSFLGTRSTSTVSLSATGFVRDRSFQLPHGNNQNVS